MHPEEEKGTLCMTIELTKNPVLLAKTVFNLRGKYLLAFDISAYYSRSYLTGYQRLVNTAKSISDNQSANAVVIQSFLTLSEIRALTGLKDLIEKDAKTIVQFLKGFSICFYEGYLNSKANNNE